MSPQRWLNMGLEQAVRAALVLALLGSLIEAARAIAGAALVGLLIGVPLTRVAWLTAAWLRGGELRFAAAGGGLLLVVAVAALSRLFL